MELTWKTNVSVNMETLENAGWYDELATVRSLARVDSDNYSSGCSRAECRFQLKRRLAADDFLLGVYDLIEKDFFS
jgi:hypothetical protein